MVYNYSYNVKGENAMDTKEIELADGKILTPVEYPDEQMKKFSEMMNSQINMANAQIQILLNMNGIHNIVIYH